MRATKAAPAGLVAFLCACGAAHRSPSPPAPRLVTVPRTLVATRVQTPGPPREQALATDEKENRLLVVDLPEARVARRVTLPPDPEDIAAARTGGIVVVVSSAAGKVTVLRRAPLRAIKTFGGFDQPHIVAISPDGQRAYVTDDSRGTLTVIRLSDLRVTSTVAVGAGAHHLTFSPDQRRVWVALGESASQISILDTTHPDHPRQLGRFSPGFAAHDLSFSPDGRRVWVTSSSGPEVTAFDARDHKAVFRIPVGPPPQHVIFADRSAYLTSGYGSRIEEVGTASGHVLARRSAPYGSFELDAAGGYVVTTSLLRGTLAVYGPKLTLLRVAKLAPATREVVLVPR